MIEPTDEMVQLIYERIDFHNHGDDGIREGLAAVLALVERDYDVRCGASGPSALTCEQRPGHTDKHVRVVPGDQVVFW